MRTATALLINAVVLTAAATLAWPGPALAQASDEATQDILYMADGRILKGQILSESRHEIEFEYHDPNVNITMTMTIDAGEISKIERDVAVEAPAAAPADEKKAGRPWTRDADEDDEAERRTFGVRRADEALEGVPSFYIVPMEGQMGTDIRVEIYEEIIEDVRAHEPDYLVIAMDSADFGTKLFDTEGLQMWDLGLDSLGYLDMYNELVRLFKTELGDIPQIMWVHDSVGISSVVALAWPTMYIKPDGRFGGIIAARRHFEAVKSDADTYGKYREAYMAKLSGFAEFADPELGDLVHALVRPELKLSASWKGREIKWRLDTLGEYVIDDNDEATPIFTAEDAEDLLICEGRADTLDDVALLSGHREYQVLDGAAGQILEDYRENWRRTLDRCQQWADDYTKFLSWAQGEDELKYLGRAKQSLERIAAAIERDPQIELMAAAMMGVTGFNITTEIELLRERIRALKESGRGGGRGGLGGGRTP